MKFDELNPLPWTWKVLVFFTALPLADLVAMFRFFSRTSLNLIEPGPPARTLNAVITPFLGAVRCPPARPVSELTSTRVHGLASSPPSSAQLCAGAELSGCLFSFAPNLNARLVAGKSMSPVAASAVPITIRFIVLSLRVVRGYATARITLDRFQGNGAPRPTQRGAQGRGGGARGHARRRCAHDAHDAVVVAGRALRGRLGSGRPGPPVARSRRAGGRGGGSDRGCPLPHIRRHRRRRVLLVGDPAELGGARRERAGGEARRVHGGRAHGRCLARRVAARDGRDGADEDAGARVGLRRGARIPGPDRVRRHFLKRKARSHRTAARSRPYTPCV